KDPAFAAGNATAPPQQGQLKSMKFSSVVMTAVTLLQSLRILLPYAIENPRKRVDLRQAEDPKVNSFKRGCKNDTDSHHRWRLRRRQMRQDIDQAIVSEGRRGGPFQPGKPPGV